MSYLKGQYKKTIFSTNTGYYVGLFRVVDTDIEEYQVVLAGKPELNAQQDGHRYTHVEANIVLGIGNSQHIGHTQDGCGDTDDECRAPWQQTARHRGHKIFYQPEAGKQCSKNTAGEECLTTEFGEKLFFHNI